MKGGEVIQLVGLVGSVVSKIIDVIKGDRMLRVDVRRGLEYILWDMRMVTMEIKSSSGFTNHGPAHETKILLLSELAMEIEDFIDTTWWVSRPCGLIFQAIGLDPRHEILEEMKHFNETVQRVREWKPDHAGDGRSLKDPSICAATWSSSSSPSAPSDAYIKTRAERILDSLLLAADGEQPPDLRVISIVGRRGVGKTALAGAVYHRYNESTEYQFLSWVVASECCDREELLGKVLNNGSACLVRQETSLRQYLRDKRYLVVIDEMESAEVWECIKDEFPRNDKRSIIIVTTSVHSIAAKCSNRGCYVYRMHGLEVSEASDMFWKIVGQENRSSPALERASDGVLKKCGGLPLALNNAANYLSQKGRATSRVTGGLITKQWQRAARELGDMVLNGKPAEFGGIRTALLQCFNSLPDYNHRSCLLYASVFPSGRSINSNVAIRRWIAEGLVAPSPNTTLTNEEVASDYLDEFIDRSVVEPVLISNTRVSKFRVYSIMHEFIIHKAVSQNFVTLVDQGELVQNKETVSDTRGPIFGVRVRRLSVQNSEKEAVDKAAAKINLSALRSLTIYRSHLLDMQSSKLLRVLDLRGCKGVEDFVCGGICKLHFLKYLSLRGTDAVILPKKMEQLQHLETLDVRDTRVNIVPIEVIRLRFLAHLLGRFALPSGITRQMLKSSRLQTLAGVDIGKADYSFENIILHARELQKVKIYQTASDFSDSLPNKRVKKSSHPRDSAPAPTSSSTLLQLKGRFTGSNALQIISIDSSDFSKEFLGFLEGPCALTTIKLRGKLDTLPSPVTLSQLVGLNKLLLISTCLSSEDLSALQYLRYLEYLKLAEHSTGFWDGSFVVGDGGFPSLKRLCFEAHKLPQMIFLPGSMKSLTILDLFCPYPVVPEDGQGQCNYWLSVQGISNITYLNEVILHHSTNDTTMRAWRHTATQHKNKPSVKRQARPKR